MNIKFSNHYSQLFRMPVCVCVCVCVCLARSVLKSPGNSCVS
jgi:hypothetical protein